MTELIIALDGPRPWHLADVLSGALPGPAWFKIGPQAMTDENWPHLIRCHLRRWRPLFLDLKLADTRDTVREAVKRFAAIGVAAVSTFTYSATNAAVEAAVGTGIKIWQVIKLTEDIDQAGFGMVHRAVVPGANGVICPGSEAGFYSNRAIDIVVPGVRLDIANDPHGHRTITTPEQCRKNSVTHAVVGRPIWQAAGPVSVALQYLAALAS